MSKIIHKKSSVALKVPLTADLEYGELALNYTDGKLYYLNSDNSVQSVAGGAAVGSSNTFTANQIIEVTDNTNAALRITQLGSGNALLVQDESPESTPFVIDVNGGVISGHTSLDSNWYSSSNTPQIIQVASVATGNRQGFASISYTGAGGFSMFRANGGVIGTEGAVVNGDATGIITFAGYDGTTSGAIPTAFIQSNVDGIVGVGDMPGRLTFHTTADGASTPTERMRISNQGNVGIGSAPPAGQTLLLSKNITGAPSSYGIVNNGVVQSDVTAAAVMYQTAPTVGGATPFTLPSLYHYQISQGTVGSGAIVTNQYGLRAESSLIGATNNYSFFSNIAAPTTGITTTGTISTISSSGTTVTVNHNAITYTNGQTVTIAATANATDLVSGATARILTLGTTDYTLIGAGSNTVGAFFTATGAGTGDGTVTLNVQGSGKTVAGAASGSFTYTTASTQTFAAVTVLTGTVTVSIRYNLYINGTAPNYMAGSLGVGTLATALIKVSLANTVTDTANTEYTLNSLITANHTSGTIAKYGARSAAITAASYAGTGILGANLASLTATVAIPGSMQAYRVNSSNTGAGVVNAIYGYVSTNPANSGGGSITNYYGFAQDDVTNAANTYGFLGGISSGSNKWNLYMSGNAANYLGGDTIVNGKIGLGTAGAPDYGSAGQVLTSAGSATSPTWSNPSGASAWVKKTANYTAVAGDKLLADTSLGSFTITLPISPVLGNSVIIGDGSDWNAINLIVARNGSTIEGGTDDITFDVRGIQVEFVYDGATWEVYAFTGPGQSVVNDTTSNLTQYLEMSRNTSGAKSSSYIASSKLYFNPSTGILTSTNYNSLSDATLKTNVKKIDNALEVLDQINPVSFDWKDTNNKSYGVIAQEIEKILPEIVATNPDTDIKSVSYIQLIPFLIQAVKDLQEEVNILKGTKQ